MIRSLVGLLLIASLAYCGATVPLGERTFFQHMANIWSSDQTQEMVEGVKETSAPLVERVKRGVKAGIEGAGGAESDDGGTGESGPAVATSDSGEPAVP